MAAERSTHSLDETQFGQALAILKAEQQANTPSRRQQIAFLLLNIAVYGFGLTVGIPIILFAAGYTLHLLDVDLAFSFGEYTLWAFDLLLIPMGLIAIGIAILFVLNLPLIVKLWRQTRLVNRLGLAEALRAPWSAERKKKRGRNVLTILVAVFGLLIVAGVLLVGLRTLEPMEVAYLAVAALVGVALVATHFMRRGSERLEVVKRLRSSLNEQSKAHAGTQGQIEIPTDQYEWIAQVERAQITRDRAQSIQAGFDKSTNFVVQKSHAVRSEQAQLEPTVRLLVQNQMESLTNEPRPPGVIEDERTQVRRLRVPDTNIEIGFAVDEEKRRVLVLSLESIAGGRTGSSRGE